MGDTAGGYGIATRIPMRIALCIPMRRASHGRKVCAISSGAIDRDDKFFGGARVRYHSENPMHESEPKPDHIMLADVASANLAAWRASGVVKTLKFYSAEDADVCTECATQHGTIVNIADGKVGVNLPPLKTCERIRCRCYFRPWDVSLDPMDTVGER